MASNEEDQPVSPSLPEAAPPPAFNDFRRRGLMEVAIQSADGSPFAYTLLDARVVKQWRLIHSIVTLVLLTMGMIGGAVLALNVSGSFVWVVASLGAVALLRLFLLIWYPARAYKAWGYRLDERVLEIRQGVWLQTLTLLPLSRVQHVDLNQGPLDRLFGLSSLTLYTAGTQNAVIQIPGLDPAEAIRLRDHLVAVGGDDAV